jgi:REP element-mobilizing transposase RayT
LRFATAQPTRNQPARLPKTEHCRIKMGHRRSRQLDLPAPSTWGGRRIGAGRKPALARPGPRHSPRPEHDRRHPVHVTLRARLGMPSFWSEAVYCQLGRALAKSSRRSFRVTQFSVQTDHLHLIVESDTALALVRGLQGLAVRCARAVNRACHRHGPVWSKRYHARALPTPREVRLTLIYVLLNFCKHLRALPAVDRRSSGPWFEGWAHSPPRPLTTCPVVPPRTWLAAIGWRRAGGPIDYREAPAPPQTRRV